MIPVIELRGGDVFRYEGKLFLRTNETHNGKVLTVNVTRGYLKQFKEDVQVEQVSVHFTVIPVNAPSA